MALTTLYVGAHYQVTDGVVTKHYQGGAFRVGGTLYYGLTDHLGSTSMTIDAGGSKLAEMRYTAWGEVRYASGSTPTDRSYAIPVGGTGQRSYTADFGLMFYNARWYDPSLGRFAQTDTIVPKNQGSQGLDRYMYVNNSPLNHIDPTGHIPEDEICKYMGHCNKKAFEDHFGKHLTELLWGTKLTWGDKLEWYKNGELQVAMLVLIQTKTGSYSGGLWDVTPGGTGISFDALIEADQACVAKCDPGNPDVVTISTVRQSNKYPDIISARDLSHNGNQGGKDYYDIPEGSAAFTIIGGVMVFVAPPVGLLGVTIGAASLTVDMSGYFQLPHPLDGVFGMFQRYPIMRDFSQNDPAGLFGIGFDSP